ncbi:hypothetical protein M1328_05435 [Patescibacteria group bacterium]|nr:hypothetical protein [Patescibacteria group bacterium]
MKITVYTTTECQFSKQEKEYLTSHNLQYEEKNLETNKDFLTEMLAVSNNFAGTPVTRVEKDDGSIAVLKGFTKEEFDTTFGFSASPAQPDQTTAAVPPATEPPKVEEAKPVEPAPEVSSTPSVPGETPLTPPLNEATASVSDINTPVGTPAKTDEQLGAVLDKLEEQTGSVNPTPAPTDVVPPPVAETPNPTPPAGSPTIPDFPSDTATQPIK